MADAEEELIGVSVRLSRALLEAMSGGPARRPERIRTRRFMCSAPMRAAGWGRALLTRISRRCATSSRSTTSWPTDRSDVMIDNAEHGPAAT